MNFLVYVLIFLVLFYLINYLWLCIYCNIEAKIDSLNLKKNGDLDEKSKESSKGKNIHDSKLKSHLKNIYKYCDHYMYGWMRYWIIKTGRIPSNRIRKFLYKYVFQMKISSKTVISGGCEIRSPWNIELGNCIVAGGCMLDGRSGIKISDNVVLGMYVKIWTQEHDINSPDFAVNDEHRGPVYIKERAWVCSDTTILPGITINQGAVIATKACVTKDCEAFGVYGGIPAKKINERNKNLTYVLSGTPHWHFN